MKVTLVTNGYLREKPNVIIAHIHFRPKRQYLRGFSPTPACMQQQQGTDRGSACRHLRGWNAVKSVDRKEPRQAFSAARFRQADGDALPAWEKPYVTGRSQHAENLHPKELWRIRRVTKDLNQRMSVDRSYCAGPVTPAHSDCSAYSPSCSTYQGDISPCPRPIRRADCVC